MKPGYLCTRIVLTGLALFALGQGCRTSPQAADVDAGDLTHHNWWNYYERGASRLAQGDVKGARMDFERCLGLRKGARFGLPKDAWRIRTYGMHFLDDYFPNREMGVCLYELGDHARAEEFLQTSLRQDGSARAKHYLNLVRAELLRHAHVAPPAVRLDAGTVARWTKQRTRRIAGTATGQGLVSSIRVNNHRFFQELARDSVPFAQEVTLREGENTIAVTVRDLAGGEARHVFVVTADWEPPHATVMSVRKDAQGWLVEGICADDRALSSAKIVDGGNVTVLNPRGETSVPLKFRLRAGQEVLLDAEDAAGNHVVLPINEQSLPLQAADACRNLFASASAGVPDAASAAAVASAPSPTSAQDRLKPSLNLGVHAEALVVYGEEFFLDGSAQDGGGLAGVTVCGENLMPPGEQGAVLYRFARRLPLDEGTNLFTVVAEDRAGNTNAKAFAVIRRLPEYLDADCRLSLGIPPIPERGDGSARTVSGDDVRRIIENRILDNPVRFHILERDEGWDFVLREQQLSLSDLADPRAALAIGKMVPAEMLLFGSVLPQGKGVTIYARVVASSDGQVLAADDVYTETPAADLEFQVEGLVMKIEQSFPLVEGTISDLAKGGVLLDVGRAQGVVAGMRFLVLTSRDDEPDLRSARVCRVGDRLVELVIKRAGSSTSTASVRPDEAAEQVRKGNLVYAR